jgi:hypothetical protein
METGSQSNLSFMRKMTEIWTSCRIMTVVLQENKIGERNFCAAFLNTVFLNLSLFSEGPQLKGSEQCCESGSALFGNLDPHQSDKLDPEPDPHQGEKSDPDPHQIFIRIRMIGSASG